MKKAGRPSKLTEHRKAEILRRLALGDKPSDLQREYKISGTTFRRNFSGTASKVRNVAVALASAESELETLPISAQISARTLADYLRSTHTNLARAAALGSQVSATLAEKAVGIVGKLGDDFSEKGTARDDLRTVNALSATANESSKIALGLVQANKGKPAEGEDGSKEELLREIAAMLPN